METTSPAAVPPQAQRKRARVRYLDGDKLLAARVELQLNQGEVARRIGGNVTQSLVSAWERGRQGTSVANVRRIARALGLEPEALMPNETLARITAGKIPGSATEGEPEAAAA